MRWGAVSCESPLCGDDSLVSLLVDFAPPPTAFFGNAADGAGVSTGALMPQEDEVEQ